MHQTTQCQTLRPRAKEWWRLVDLGYTAALGFPCTAWVAYAIYVMSLDDSRLGAVPGLKPGASGARVVRSRATARVRRIVLHHAWGMNVIAGLDRFCVSLTSNQGPFRPAAWGKST